MADHLDSRVGVKWGSPEYASYCFTTCAGRHRQIASSQADIHMYVHTYHYHSNTFGRAYMHTHIHIFIHTTAVVLFAYLWVGCLGVRRSLKDKPWWQTTGHPDSSRLPVWTLSYVTNFVTVSNARTINIMKFLNNHKNIPFRRYVTMIWWPRSHCIFVIIFQTYITLTTRGRHITL